MLLKVRTYTYITVPVAKKIFFQFEVQEIQTY